MLKTQLAPLQTPLGCSWPARSRNPLKERFAMLKMKTLSRRRRLFGAGTISLIVASAGYGAWASNDEVRAATQEVVAAAARPAPVLLTQAAPARIERKADATSLKSATPEGQTPIAERPLTEREQIALDSARAALAQAYEYERLGLVSKPTLAAEAARVAKLEVALGQKATATQEALRLAQAALDDSQEKYKAGLASRSDIGLAAERLVRLQLALGQQPTAQFLALEIAREDVETVRAKYNIGVSSLADMASAAERVRRLETVRAKYNIGASSLADMANAAVRVQSLDSLTKP
jgi:hypothetical protein